MVLVNNHSQPSSSYVQQHEDEQVDVPSQPRTVDELIRARAQTIPNIPLVSYPHHGLDYVDYTARQLDQYAYHVAKQYAGDFPPRTQTSDKILVVGLLGLSSLDYLISAMAVVKLGHTALHLSTRISHEAYVSLLVQTGAAVLLTDETMCSTAFKCGAEVPHLIVRSFLTLTEYAQPVLPHLDTNLTPTLDLDAEQKTIAWIIHSSGSTGLPKPIYQTQAAALNNYKGNMDMKGFITLPLFHAHGISSTYRAIYSGKQIHMYNAGIPLTKQYLIEVMRRYRFEIFYGVPYVLKLLAEDQEGISLLAQCKVVMFGGSACPDPLGDKLVENGVNLVSHWGSTETGQLMTSFRPLEDKAWNYLRPSESVQPYLRMEDRGEGLFEAICLPGWPSKVAINRPDGSYAMQDLFTKHPEHNWWKYYGRLDDTIVLVNGEKAMPLPIEGAAKQHTWVSEAVVFGKGRDRLGLALVRSPSSVGTDANSIARSVVASIERSQATMPAYARIAEDMVLVLDADTDYPRTDKGTAIRMKFYKRFEQEIDALYQSIDNQSGTLNLNEDELHVFLSGVLQSLSPELMVADYDQDFFNAGMDSLVASRLRAAIIKDIALGDDVTLGINVAFEHPSISQLAKHLYALRMGLSGQDSLLDCAQETMQHLVDKYTEVVDFSITRPQLQTSQLSSVSTSQANAVILTGVTGSLGAHIASILAQNPTITSIYCLIRASDVLQARSRLAASFAARGLPVPSFDAISDSSSSPSSSLSSLSSKPSFTTTKFVPLPSDTTRPDLGLDEPTLSLLRSTSRTIIHSAWSVNFNLSLSSFEDCIRSTQNLIQFASSMGVYQSCPVTFNFCSSVSTVMNTARAVSNSSSSSGDTGCDNDRRYHITESVPPLTHAQSMGYAQSKLVAEHICKNLADSISRHGNDQTSMLTTRVLRIGQIIGDTVCGIWNAKEAIPMMIQSATTIGALPTLNENVRWLPVDVVAAACADIALPREGGSSSLHADSASDHAGVSSSTNKASSSSSRCQVYNIVNPQTIHWTRDLLPTLKQLGLKFDAVPVEEWLSRLRRSSQDPITNPPIKLLDFWTGKYGDGGGGGGGEADLDDHDNQDGMSTALKNERVEYTWAIENATTASPALNKLLPAAPPLLAADENKPAAVVVLDVVKLSLAYFREKCW